MEGHLTVQLRDHRWDLNLLRGCSRWAGRWSSIPSLMSLSCSIIKSNCGQEQRQTLAFLLCFSILLYFQSSHRTPVSWHSFGRTSILGTGVCGHRSVWAHECVGTAQGLVRCHMWCPDLLTAASLLRKLTTCPTSCTHLTQSPGVCLCQGKSVLWWSAEVSAENKFCFCFFLFIFWIWESWKSICFRKIFLNHQSVVYLQLLLQEMPVWCLKGSTLWQQDSTAIGNLSFGQWL